MIAVAIVLVVGAVATALLVAAVIEIAIDWHRARRRASGKRAG